MLGVWVNFAAVVVGGIVGTLLRGGIKERFQQTINAGLALCVMVIGISGAIKTSNIMIVIVSIVIGSLIGEALRIESRVDALGFLLQKKFAKSDTGFAHGFVSATLLFSIGAMAIVGSLEAGLSQKYDTLFAKSAIDGVSAIIFASSFGIGVAFASVPLTIYQGAIALLAGVLSPYLTDALVTEMSATGSVLIIILSINMLGLTKERIRVANMLPAVFIPCVYLPVAEWITKLLG